MNYELPIYIAALDLTYFFIDESSLKDKKVRDIWKLIYSSLNAFNPYLITLLIDLLPKSKNFKEALPLIINIWGV